MKKKVFSLMMTLLLAFVGLAKADVIELGDGSTTTNSYLPSYSLYNYSLTQQIYTADEIGTAGTINSIAFYNGGTEKTRTYTMYLVNTDMSNFSGNTGWITVTAADQVFTGSVTMVAGAWTTITLDTPFAYDGVNNLAVIMDDNTGSWSSGMSCRVYNGQSNCSLRVYSDGTNYDPYAPTSYSGTLLSVKNCIQIDITPGGGGGGAQIFAVQNGEVVQTVYVGTRPNGCWMEPFTFQLRNTGANTRITRLDWTPDEYFTLVAPELPVVIIRNEDMDVQLATGTSSNTQWQMVAIYGTGRTAAVWDIVADPYNPAVPDVWEFACQEATTFPFVEIPATAHNTVLHNDYTLPFPEIPEGYDAVYKLVFDHDQILDAEVTYGANGKVALYTEDFYGEGGPMAHNYYTGIGLGGPAGGGGAAFEAQIGEGTSTSSYFPYHSLWNYSLAENLYLASELTEAGVTTAPMTSLSWYVSSMTNTTPQNNISIWMGNVSDAELTSTSHTTAGMTLVYTGSDVLPTAGTWNEFVFNEGNFAWDGHSNIVIVCQRNNGTYQGSISWQTHNPGFTAMCYHYSDTNGGYDVSSQPFTGMYTSSTNRANIIMKSDGSRNANRDDVVVNFEDQQIPADWNNDATYPWVVVSENGSYVMKSSNGGNASTTSTISATYELNDAGSISFDALCMGEGTSTIWDKCIFEIDGQQQFCYGANVSGWNNYSYNLNPGSHTFTWKYSKDGSVNPTGDYFMVDNITITGMGEPLPEPELDYSFGPVIEDLPLRGGTYYLVASSTDPDFEVTINAEDMPCPEVEGFAFNPTPADNADGLEPNSVTLRWNIPTNSTGWRLIFGTTYHPEPGHPQTIMFPADGSFTTNLANSYTVRNLWNNTNYFWRVEFNNDGCPDGVSSPVWGFTTHLNIPQNLTAVDYTVFDDETITLNWNAVADRTYRMYNVYRDGELIGHTTVNNIGNTTYTDGPLAYNMGGYVYYVTAVYDEGESAPSDPVTVKVSGYGNVNGHVYEQDGTTGIANATVTMVGHDEFGDSHTYNFTTNYQGYYSGTVYAGEYNGSASCNGYFTVTAPVQGNPIAIVYDQTTSPIDYIMDENFDPVCQVIAEYYPDSLDPNSPYVKVYWGCGLPGSEIVEPFETGDFSLFDWNITGSYPWEVTTTHPYEGEYCMRSTNYNVASSTSSIDVTVDIPADGIMSFFGYISSENNWDYGYFYIDGVQRGSYTGAGNSWGEKKFDITQGTHNFKWEYTKDGSVNSNEDRFYVDYITFYKQPEPVQPGWHTYAESEFNNALGSNLTTTPSWAYEYPTNFLHTNYAGWNITKVSLFSDNMYSAVGGNYTCRIYVGGTQPAAGTMVSTITVDVPSNQNAWVDWDLTTPVNVTGNEPIWVVWTANTTVSSWPAGLCGDQNDFGNWWDGGNGWDHQTYGTWTMRHWFTNRAGRSVAVSTIDDVNPINSKLRTYAKGEENNDIICANPNAERIESTNVTRAFSHYRVYRTDCYNDGPYTAENTMVLSCELTDTVYIDTYWADPEVTPPGIYKWGVGVVYVGNRGEEVESPITWSEPININPETASRQVVTIGEGTSTTYVTPFNSLWGYSVVEQLFTADEIGTAGAINSISFNLRESDAAQTNQVDVFMKNVSRTNFASSTDFEPLTAGDMVFSGTVTFNPGWTTITLDSPFAYNGTDNLLIAFHEYTSGYSTRYFYYTSATGMVLSYHSDSANPDPYNLGSFSGSKYTSANRANIQIDITPGGGGNNGGNGGNEPIQEPRESEIVWSNCLDKDMYLSNVDVTVLLNSADSPEGTTVKFRNYNEVEQQLYPIDMITLDGTGYYAFESFRRGAYEVTVEKEGYETIVDSINLIDNPNNFITELHLRYVMIEILYGVENIYVSRTGWAMWDDSHNNPGGTPGGGGGGQGNGSTFNENFDTGIPTGWTTLDADGDGLTWVSSMNPGVYHNSGVSLEGTGHNSSPHYVISGSYANQTGQALTPDNYFVSPQVTLANGSTFSFWACAQDASWAAEHFGVAISSNGTSDWTMVNEWTMTAKNGGSDVMSMGRNGDMRAQGNWYQYSVDLSAYAGQKYIAIRHFNCTDQFILNVDDAALTNGAKNADEMMHFEYYKVMCTSIDGVPIYNHNTVHPFCQLSTNEPYNAPLVEGERYLCKVATVYSTGMSAWSAPVEWQYEPCDHWGPVDEVTVNTTGQGNHIEWVFEHGYNPYGGGTPGPGPQPGNEATIILTAGDVWGDGSGYQMLLDADATAFGTTIPETGALSLNCSGNEAIYAEFEYKIPTNADGNCSTQNMVMNNSISITVPAGTYDWCITNPTPGDRIWIASSQGNVGGRQNDYVFEAGNTYEFTVSMMGSNDAVNVTVTGGGKSMVAPMPAGEVKDIANVTPIKGGSQSFVKGGEFYNQYAEDGIMLNFFAIDNVDLRAFMLYNLSNDSRFSIVPEDEYGQFILTSLTNDNFLDEFETVYQNTIADFSLISKVDMANRVAAWKTGVAPSNFLSIMMDVMTSNNRPDNDHCVNSLPFCTSELIQFEAASTDQTANEPNMNDGCIGSSYNPSFYHMRIHTAGPFVIHMEGHDPTTGVDRDIDFCMWGPYTEEEVLSGTACSNLTGDKIMDCCYSAYYAEDCFLGYPEGQHQHNTSHGTINYHVPEVGEYYILMITNFSRQPCVINFTKTEGEGETDCEIVIPTDLIGFLITQDGEYLAFAGPDDREYDDLGEFGDHEYCVRPIYPGTMILPDQNFGWSMGCPVCTEPSDICAPGDDIHGEAITATDQVKIWWGEENPGPGPGGCEGDEFLVNFDDSQMPAGWTTIDANNDGYDWVLGSQIGGIYLAAGASLAGSGHNASNDMICSGSYSNATGQAITPDNYLVSPAVTLCEGSTFSFWACGQDANYVAEHFGVAISDDGVNFGMVQEWTMTAKNSGAMSIGRDGQTRAQGSWHQYTVDLSDYAGEGRYIAIRHFNCSDMFILDVDDIQLTAGSKGLRSGIESYNVYRSTDNANYSVIQNVPAVAGQTYYEYIDTPETAGTYYYQVTAVYANCESEPATAALDPSVNYVVISVDAVDENGGMAIYPNPTKGNVTIEANGMRHITVVSMLGQVVFDADVENDTYILNMSQYTAGMYTVRVTTENGVNVSRITVVR